MKTILFSLEYFKFLKSNENIKNLLSILKILSAINLSAGKRFVVGRDFWLKVHSIETFGCHSF